MRYVSPTRRFATFVILWLSVIDTRFENRFFVLLHTVFDVINASALLEPLPTKREWRNSGRSSHSFQSIFAFDGIGTQTHLLFRLLLRPDAFPTPLFTRYSLRINRKGRTEIENLQTEMVVLPLGVIRQPQLLCVFSNYVLNTKPKIDRGQCAAAAIHTQPNAVQ